MKRAPVGSWQEDHFALEFECGRRLGKLISPIRIRTLATLCAATVTLLALTACSDSEEPTVTPQAVTPTVTTTATATPQPSPTATVPPDSDLISGGIARFALSQAPPHQDVHQSASNVLATWGPGIAYSRLFRLQRGPNVPMPSRIPECDLCESWIQTGPLEFEFKLRDDVFWPDIAPTSGRRVTAGDVVFSLERQRTSDWPNAELLSNLDEIEAVDENTLRITLRTADAEIFEKLANGRSVIVARELVELDGDLVDGPTIGTGPWVLEEISSDGASFEANRDYYGTGPHVDGLAVQFIAQATTRAAGVRADILDFAESTAAEVRAAVDRFPSLQSVSIDRPGSGVEVALNSSISPLDRSEVREAILLAWNPRQVVTDIWDTDLDPSVGLNLPDPGWNVDFETEYADIFGDIGRSRALLEAAELDADLSLAIRVGEFGQDSENDRYVRTAEAMAESLAAAGLDVIVEPVTTRFFADEVWLRGEYEIFIGAPPPVESLSGQLFGIYHSQGPWNTTGFASDELDALIEQQATELDRARRGQLVRDIQDLIMKESQRFFMVTEAGHWLWQPRVQGIYPDTSGASGDFLASVWLQP